MLRFALVAAVCAAAVQTGLHLGGVWLLDGRFASLDARSDRGIGGSAVVVAGEIAALGALVACVRARTRADALRLGFLAAALGFLGIDRVAALHDRIAYGLADRANLPHAAAWATLIVYAPLLLPSAWILWFALPGDVGTRTARAGIARASDARSRSCLSHSSSTSFTAACPTARSATSRSPPRRDSRSPGGCSSRLRSSRPPA